MRLPRGRLVRSRVVSDPRTVLVDALDRELTGYAVFEPQGALLLDAGGDGVLTFERGVPVVAYHTGTGRGGPPALADLAAEGPYQLELFAADPAELEPIHDRPSLTVPPEMPADRLAGDRALADRTCEVARNERRPETTRRSGPESAPATGSEDNSGTPHREADVGSSRSAASAAPDAAGAERQPGAVEAFLDDAEKIEAIREEARAEAEARADDWGF